jgi:DNA topoisomerase I
LFDGISEAPEHDLGKRLRYVSDRVPGFARLRKGDGFAYRDCAGVPIEDEAVLARINALAIPPAYTAVWICADPIGHLQAVGRDAKGRKQYRYHPHWRGVRDKAKFEKLLHLARALPRIRRRVSRDIAKAGLPRDKVLATIVWLLEHTYARVGNEEYARANHSFGLTTLRNRHVRIARGRIVFDFRAKHGIRSHIDIEDRRLARIVKGCQELPGQELFEYIDVDQAIRSLSSENVNDYLRTISGEQITAKDFRTWAATRLAARALRQADKGDAPTKKHVVAAVEQVAKLLGNTPSVCRKCYIHPAVLAGYLEGNLLESLIRYSERNRRQVRGLR